MKSILSLVFTLGFVQAIYLEKRNKAEHESVDPIVQELQKEYQEAVNKFRAHDANAIEYLAKKLKSEERYDVLELLDQLLNQHASVNNLQTETMKFNYRSRRTKKAITSILRRYLDKFMPEDSKAALDFAKQNHHYSSLCSFVMRGTTNCTPTMDKLISLISRDSFIKEAYGNQMASGSVQSRASIQRMCEMTLEFFLQNHKSLPDFLSLCLLNSNFPTYCEPMADELSTLLEGIKTGKSSLTVNQLCTRTQHTEK